MVMQQKTVMVFGVFDLLHDGHRHFLSEARRLGSRLTVVLAEDSVVLNLKSKLPFHSLAARRKNLEAEKLADAVLAGDKEIGSWNIIRKNFPDVIALGYDQKELSKSLRNFLAENDYRIPLTFIKPYEKGALHSSVLFESGTLTNGKFQ